MTETPYYYNATVVRWIDGDSVWLDVDLGFRMSTTNDFRLIGIDTPERGQPNHAEATALANKLAPAGSQVCITTYRDPDKYGRWLVAITEHGPNPVSINSQLVQAGLAKPYFGGKKQ